MGKGTGSRELLPSNMDEEILDPFPTDPSEDDILQHGVKVQSDPYVKPKPKEHGQKACMKDCDSFTAEKKSY